MDVTTAMRLTPLAFMADMTALVPSVSMESPTSEVFPPRATMTPSMVSASNTLATSAGFVTSPPMRVRLGSERGLSASAPPEPFGITSFEGFLFFRRERQKLCVRNQSIKHCVSCWILEGLMLSMLKKRKRISPRKTNNFITIFQRLVNTLRSGQARSSKDGNRLHAQYSLARAALRLHRHWRVASYAGDGIRPRDE